MDGPIVPHMPQWPRCEVRSECPQLLSLDSNGLVRWVKAYEGQLPLFKL